MGRTTIPKSKYESKEEFLSRLQKSSQKSSINANTLKITIIFCGCAFLVALIIFKIYTNG